MTCQHVKMPGGVTAIVCSRNQRKRKCKCGRPGTLLCDWKMPGKARPTCDKPICDRCATSPAPDKDLCPKHAWEWTKWKSQRGLGL